MNSLEKKIEALLYICGDKGISAAELMAVLDIAQQQVIESIDNLNNYYQANNSALIILNTANLYKQAIREELYDIGKAYANLEFNDRLSNACLETLAIIAYKQPITRFLVDETRGVSTAHHFNTLLNKNLIKIVGKSEEIGRPNLYGTTPEFLDYLGINDISELPPLNSYDLNHSIDKEALFSEDEDFKTIKNRLLSEENVIQEFNEPDIADIDTIVIKEVEIPHITPSQGE